MLLFNSSATFYSTDEAKQLQSQKYLFIYLVIYLSSYYEEAIKVLHAVAQSGFS